VGRLATGYNTARFASTLAMLTGAGVPLFVAGMMVSAFAVAGRFSVN
jgi:type II secretory pathway component PulF